MSSQRIVLLLFPMVLAAQPAWRVTSGGVEYRLERCTAGIAWSYFGPEREKPWAAPSSEMEGLVESQSLTAANLDLAEATTATQELKLRMRHKQLPIEVEARYRGWGATGTLTREWVISAPSLAWRLPPGEYELVTESLGAGSRTFVNRTGRSANGASPWFCLHNKTLGVRYAGQLAWSGNWEMSFERAAVRADLPVEQGALTVKMGMRFDFGGALTLPPPAHVEPEGWTAMQYAQPDRRSVEWDGSLRTGAELMTQGITVKLDEPWRAGVIEIHAER